jgi:hypothetical protein
LQASSRCFSAAFKPVKGSTASSHDAGFVLEADPARGRTEDGRLFHDGRPLPGSLVVAYRKDAGLNSAPNSVKEELRARTDKDGRIVVPVTGGLWLLKSVYMQRAAAGSGADWESVWTALTFKVG